MLLSYPPAFRYEGNPNVPTGSIDYSLTSPLNADGSNFPCKGYQSDLGSAAGASVATWSAGGTYNFTIGGSAAHDGGSCQVALSYDKGKTFTVIHSYIGGCPTVNPAGGSFNFNVPSDAPQGAALFAWTWFNEVGNREMYMDCASVIITGSTSAKRASKRAGTSFSSRPSLFVANLGNGCTTIETTDLTFPDPGPDITNVSKAPGGVTGTCKQVAGIGDFSSGSGNTATSPVGSSAAASSNAATSPAGTSAQASSSSPVYSTSSANAGTGTMVTAVSSYAAQTSSGFQTVTTSAAASTAASTGTSTSGLSLSSDGSCGGSFGCQGSVHGNCCSQWGWCGSTSAYCGTGCQSAFGTCGTANTSSTGSTALQVSTDKTCGPTTSNTCQGSTFGNCCSQYGYCGGTSDYCGTGCQSGFGTCGQVSSGNSSSPSGMSSSSPSTMSSSSAASQAVSYPVDTMTETITYITTMTQTASVYTAVSNSSISSPSFVSVTQATSQGSTFITMVKPTTTSTSTSTSSTSMHDLVTIIPTHLRRRQSGLTISPNGLCGSSTGYTCQGSNFGDCCSQYGYCGSTGAYCDNGCQGSFGSCNKDTITIIPITTDTVRIIPITTSP
jgi:hypothetical protein